ncbi:MAG TPA: M48 family metallopeptidase [Blastocatellia bacterium]|nr:M48 family metallopeptidase [Blastocatellia bacterium]
MLQHLDGLRFNYENKLFMQLQMDPSLSQSLSAMPRLREFHARKRQVLGSAVKITPALIPELYELYQTCLKFFGGKIQGDLYVQQQTDYNAYVYSAGDRFDIIVSSAIVKDFKKQEIAFVIGHELGHVLFEHNKIPVGHILQNCEGLSYELAHRLFQWSRAAEISADRIGLLCGGSLSSAANAFFKLSSGLSLQNEEEIIRSLRMQFDEIKKLSGTSDDWVCTHPLIPIRFKSLELIALDILALRNHGMQSKLSWAQIDSQISEVLIETEPLRVTSYLSSKEGVSLLVLCLLYVAIADGSIHPYEEQFIYDVRKRAALNINIEDVISVCRRDLADFARVAISEIRGMRIEKDDAIRIVQLCHYLAISDTPLNNDEFRALNEICAALGCEAWVVDSVISQHEGQ